MLRLSYLSKRPGIGCAIKQTPDDFIVQEIDQYGTVYEIDKEVGQKWKNPEDYVMAVLQKKNWTTQDAAQAVTALLRVSRQRASFAGSKDRRAITTQLLSVLGSTPERMRDLKIKDIRILGAWYWDRPVRLGDLIGNRFIIHVPESMDRGSHVSEIYDELKGLSPNYFGEQRFGNRWNTHLIGKHILKRQFAEAVMEYLTRLADEPEEVKDARMKLAQTHDYKNALKEYPKYLKYERVMLAHLAKTPNDHIGALRRLPRALGLMFIHAYQAHLFNTLLSQRIEEKNVFDVEKGEYRCGINWYGFPDTSRINGRYPVGRIIGHSIKPNEREQKLLEEEEIRPSDFMIKQFPELSAAGDYRPYLIPIKDFSFKSGKFMFELPAGSYATVVMREFMDNKPSA